MLHLPSRQPADEPLQLDLEALGRALQTLPLWQRLKLDPAVCGEVAEEEGVPNEAAQVESEEQPGLASDDKASIALGSSQEPAGSDEQKEDVLQDDVVVDSQQPTLDDGSDQGSVAVTVANDPTPLAEPQAENVGDDLAELDDLLGSGGAGGGVGVGGGEVVAFEPGQEDELDALLGL